MPSIPSAPASSIAANYRLAALLRAVVSNGCWDVSALRGAAFKRSPPTLPPPKPPATFHGIFFGHLAFFGQPPKCEVAHTSLPIRPSKVRQGDCLSGTKRGHQGTKTSYRLDCSCTDADRPNGHDVGHAERVTDFRSSTFAFVLSLQSPTTGLRNESVDGSDCPTLRVEYRPSSRHIQHSP